MRTPLLFILLLFTAALPARQLRDSLLLQWSNPVLPDTVRLESLDELIWSCYMNTNPDSTEYYAHLEFDFAEKQELPVYMGYALNAIGLSWSDRGDNYKAIDYHHKALELRQRMKDERGTAVSWNNLGLCYFRLGQYAQATECYFKALKIRDKIGDRRGYASSLGNIGAVYQQQGDRKTAMQYAQRSLAIYDSLQDKNRMAMELSNMSFMVKQLGDTAKSIEYQQRCLALYRESNNLQGYARALQNLATTYCDLHRYAEADSCAFLSLEISRQINAPAAAAYALYTLAINAYFEKNTARSISYAEQALAIADSLHSLTQQYSVGDFLYHRYADAGNYRKAMEVLEKAAAAHDSLQAQKLDEKIYKEQLKYDYEKQTEQLRAESIRRELRQATRTDEETLRRNRWIAIFVVLLAILSGGIFFFVRNSRQKSLIAAQKNNLLKQQLLISQLNPHFIFNSLNAIQQFIFSQDSLQAGNYLAQFAGLMRMILNFSREDFIDVAAEEQFLGEYLALQQLRFRNSFSYRIEVDPSIDTEATRLPPMLAQPFVENAVEHGVSRLSSGGMILVRLSRAGERLRYDIEDNGPGLPAQQTDAARAHQPLATIITRERLEAFGGNADADIHIENKTTGGVHVWFTFPFQQVL